jgi:NAD(P)-dependent dehydrogenase (short-subunit alcohol dehydrogenase family)
LKLTGKAIVITGAAGGIGRALAHRFAHEQPRGIVLTDIACQESALCELAAALETGDGAARPAVPAVAVPADVCVEADVLRVVAAASAKFGHVDVFCSNAGLLHLGDENAPDAIWNLDWQIHVMAHLYAARAVVPGMRARGMGYLMNTVSSAGLNTQVGAASYAVSKHASLALAEWLSIEHGAAGVRVSVLCPRGVDTPMSALARGGGANSGSKLMSPEAVADIVVAGIDAERFLILPHQESLGFVRDKAEDYDGWITKMRQINAGRHVSGKATS